MALRVLLADESATIKKVILLALKEFGVEVKSVPVGTDVLPVARTFKPDVVFADVLLTKRNGYETCHDLKNDPDFAQTPVILMWSGFMELDQSKVLSSRVDRTLEKPFDPEQLRALVRELVPVLQTNLISPYLQFPERPEFVESSQPEAPKAELSAKSSPQIQMPGDDDVEEFKHVPLPKNRVGESAAESFQRTLSRTEPRRNHSESTADTNDEWSQADLAKFRLNLNDNHEEVSLPEIDENVSDSNFIWSTSGEEVSLENFDQPVPAGARRPTDSAPRFSAAVNDALAVPSLDFERAEQILREQAREVLETVAWRILPDIAERIVREELQKLLKDSERLDEI